MDYSDSSSVSLPSELSPFLFATVPRLPGVYWFKDQGGSVMYVGKAKNLRSRLKSYAYGHNPARTKKMTQVSSEVTYLVLESELQALLLEAELIKTYQPTYNIRLKDDKSCLYVAITNEKTPRLLAVRKTNLNKPSDYAHHFGPFSSSQQVKQLLRLVRKIFPFCSQKILAKQKACFYVHLGLCPGPCCGLISHEDYQKQVDNIARFFGGEVKKILLELKKELLLHSKALEFEEAAKLKHQVELIEFAMTHRKVFDQEDVLPGLDTDPAKNMIIALRRFLAHVPVLNNNSFNRIEAYDASNLEGEQATVSMVVFNNGKPDKSAYRHFRIKTFNSPNDPGMLAEALNRRQKHPEWGIPDLVLVDGGKTQLNAACDEFSWSVPVVSLAKNPDRLMMQNPNTDSEDKYIIVRLRKNHPASQLLQHLRDEAHRFAKRYHSKLYGKSLVSG